MYVGVLKDPLEINSIVEETKLQSYANNTAAGKLPLEFLFLGKPECSGIPMEVRTEVHSAEGHCDEPIKKNEKSAFLVGVFSYKNLSLRANNYHL